MELTADYVELIKFGACCGCISLLLWIGYAFDRFIDWTIDKKAKQEELEKRIADLERCK